MAPYPLAVRPRLVKQLRTGSTTASSDCGAVSVVNAILLASRGLVGPGSPGEDREWVERIRDWADNPDGPMKVRAHITAALQHPRLAERFADQGLPPLDAEYHAAIAWDDMKSGLADGHPVVLAIDYGQLALRGKAPIGSNTFRDGHAIVLSGKRTKDGFVYTHDGDPLFDGRSAGYPSGYQTTRLRYFRVAAAHFGDTLHPGAGHACCVIVKGGDPSRGFDQAVFDEDEPLSQAEPLEPTGGVELEDDPDLVSDPTGEDGIDDDDADEPGAPDDPGGSDG